MKRGLVVLGLVCNTFVTSSWAGYYPPTFGGYNIDTLTSGSRTNFGLTLGTERSSDTSGFPVIKADAFIQSGGTHNIEGPLTVQGHVEITGVGGRGHTHFYFPYYRLRGGRLNCHDITVTTAMFMQSGGTNHVQGGLVVDGRSHESTTSYGLSGGRLITSNVVIRSQGRFGQIGGVHVVRNLLAVHGIAYYPPDYRMDGGKLFVRDILLSGGAIFLHSSRGVIRHSGTLTLAGGRWSAASGLSQLGILQLSSSRPSEIALSWFAQAALRFADSAHVAWAPDALLIIHNWRTETNGAPMHPIYFGNDRFGLTSEQLAQIRFRNPFGYPPGDYPARIRRDGEVRPAPLP